MSGTVQGADLRRELRAQHQITKQLLDFEKSHIREVSSQFAVLKFITTESHEREALEAHPADNQLRITYPRNPSATSSDINHLITGENENNYNDSTAANGCGVPAVSSSSHLDNEILLRVFGMDKGPISPGRGEHSAYEAITLGGSEPLGHSPYMCSGDGDHNSIQRMKFRAQNKPLRSHVTEWLSPKHFGAFPQPYVVLRHIEDSEHEHRLQIEMEEMEIYCVLLGYNSRVNISDQILQHQILTTMDNIHYIREAMIMQHANVIENARTQILEFRRTELLSSVNNSNVGSSPSNQKPMRVTRLI